METKHFNKLLRVDSSEIRGELTPVTFEGELGQTKMTQELLDVYQKPSEEFIQRDKRAFDAALAYEENCIEKYDYVDERRPSRPPKKGERMDDFANRYGTTVQEMKNQWRQVEQAIKVKRINFKKDLES